MKKKNENGWPNMTPMIDVVFQLIIFFLVSTSIASKYNDKIKLPGADHGDRRPVPYPLTIEVDKRGWIAMNGAAMSLDTLEQILTIRREQMGPFPVMIRGDSRTRHDNIEPILDLCAKCDLHRINFVVMHKESK